MPLLLAALAGFLAVMLSGTLPLRAQPPSGQYKDYIPDTTFRIVGVNVHNWKVVKDLGLDYTRDYGRKSIRGWDSAVWLPLTMDPHDTTTYNWELTQQNFWRSADSAGFHIITPIEDLGVDLPLVREIENFGKANDVLFHNLGVDSVDTARATYDTTLHGIAYGIATPAEGHDMLLARGIPYTSGEVFFEGDSATYAKMGLPPAPTTFRATVSFRADTAFMNNALNHIDDTTRIAYFILYHRSRKGQETCKCSVFAPIGDTVWITKKKYLTGATYVDSLLDYRDLDTVFDDAWQVDTVEYDSTVKIRSLADPTKDSLVYYDTLQTPEFSDSSVVFISKHFVPLADSTLDSATRYRWYTEGIQIYHLWVPLEPRATPEGYIFGTGNAWWGSPTKTGWESICDSMAAAGAFEPGAIALHGPYNYESDFDIAFHSTGVVPITFLRYRINQDLYDYLQNPALRARLYDSVILPAATLLYDSAGTTARTLLGRVAYSDETCFWKINGDGYNARLIQDALRQVGDSTRQLWCNPQSNPDELRVLSGDLDTTRLRTLQLLTRQDYVQIGGIRDGLPIYYADPDSMSAFANTVIYGKSDTVTWWDDIRQRDSTSIYHSTLPQSGYDEYTRIRQYGDPPVCHGWGSFRASQTSGDAAAQGATVTTLARLVTAARFRYPGTGPAPTIWNDIQDMGWRTHYNMGDVAADSGTYFTPWSSRPPTAEEIKCQCWLSLNCGVDGIVFTDCQIDGPNWGFLGDATGADLKDTMEYHNWVSETLSDYVDTLSRLKQSEPVMWIGMRTRYDAVKDICQEFRMLADTLHIPLMGFKQEQMSVFDTLQSFTDMPLIDTLLAEQAKHHDTTSTGDFADSLASGDTVYDARAKTYIELSHFTAAPGDKYPTADYFCITNRRTWPIDDRHYGDTARAYGADSIGLGAIDVRRPVVRFSYPATGVMTDSLIVEEVGHADRWPAHRVAVGDLVPLDWIKPGEGAFYRVRVIPSYVTSQATAWASATHAINPSTDSTPRARMMVYERDSAVYLRTMTTTGAWGHEWLVSDPVDTTIVTASGTTRRKGWNFSPAIAVLRNDSATFGSSSAGISALVVWERRNLDGDASVEALYLDSLPSEAYGPTASTPRKELLPPTTPLESWMTLAPAAVGVDSGYVIAWADPTDTGGVDVIALRDNDSLNLYSGFGGTDTSSILRAKRSRTIVGTNVWPPDSICQFPTLAYSRNFTSMWVDSGTYSMTIAQAPYPLPEGEPDSLIGPGNGTHAHDSLHAVVLAYQQGMRNNTSWRIMYNTLGVAFPLGSDGHASKPKLWLSPAEHVSANVPGCEQIHPSIAMDSTSTAVAWETSQATHSITLRFRNFAPLDEYVRPLNWTTPYYKWGGVTVTRPWQFNLRSYARPSLTQFPSLRHSELKGVPEGVLTWEWSNAPNGSSGARKNRLMLYRYGNTWVDSSLADGMYPTMMLAPNLQESRVTAFTTSSILHRGSLAEQVHIGRPAGGTGTYFPAYLINTPAVPSSSFSQPLRTGNTITGSYFIGFPDSLYSTCTVRTGINVGILLHDGPYGRQDTLPPASVPHVSDWGPPPMFFMPPQNGDQPVVINTDLGQVVRTGPFLADTGSLTIERLISGTDSLTAWLDTQPYDSAAGHAANIYLVAQLVRVSDDSVLWTGDSVSARSVGPDTADEYVTIPMGTYAPQDTAVYVRFLPIPSPGIAYTVSGEFDFNEGSAGSAYKLVRSYGETGADTANPVTVVMVPNPTRAGTGELHISVHGEGTASIAIYDILGARVLRLPKMDVEHSGEYTVPVDVRGLRDGVYVVDVQVKSPYAAPLHGVTRFTVMR